MLRVEERESNLSVVKIEPLGPAVWSGCIMFCLALIPVISAPGLTVLRLLTMVVLALAAGALIQLGLPKKTVVFGSLASLAQGTRRARELALSGTTEAEPPLYRAELVFDDGARVVILEGDEPARVLAGAELVSERLALPLSLAWGLERLSPTELLPSSRASGKGSDPAKRATLAVYPAQQRVAYATFGGAIFIALVTVALALEPPRAARTLTSLSLILPAITVVIGLVLGIVFQTLEARLELRDGVLARRYCLAGVRFGKPRELCRNVTALFAVAPDGGPTRHLLVRTEQGLESVFAGNSSAVALLGARESAKERAEATL
jgi:hypothetical protein